MIESNAMRRGDESLVLLDGIRDLHGAPVELSVQDARALAADIVATCDHIERPIPAARPVERARNLDASYVAAPGNAWGRNF